MKNRLMVDAEVCTGCRLCEFFCSLTKFGEVNPYKTRLRLFREEPNAPIPDDSKNRVPVCVPLVCQHCTKAPCLEACPVQAISVDATTGAVILDEQKCIGCKACAEACPFHAIFETPEGQIIKCDLCGGDPECAKHCSTKALTFTSVGQAFSEARQQRAEKLAPKILHHPALV